MNRDIIKILPLFSLTYMSMLFTFHTLGMSENNVKTLLLLNSISTNWSFSFLFHCARYWAQEGNRVLFISKAPVRCLPFALGKADTSFNPDEFKLIQFMYLTNWQELLKQLYSIHLRRSPVSIIIVRNLETYFEEKTRMENCYDHVSLICASLLHAASVCAKLTSQQTILINNYFNEDSVIFKNVIKNFFTNVWKIQSDTNKENNLIQLSKVSPSSNNDFILFKFNENLEELKLTFTEVVQKIIN